MTLEEFVTKFNLKYFNSEVVRAQQTEFLNLKQAKMSVAETIRKFERLERLCQFLQLSEWERICRMLETFRLEIAIFVETGGLTATMVECYERALCAEFRLNQIKEDKARRCEDRGRKKNSSSEISIQPSSSEKGQGSKKKTRLSNPEGQKTHFKKKSYVLKAYYMKCRHNHAGVCRRTKIVCFYCEGKWHLARDCPNKEFSEEKKNQQELWKDITVHKLEIGGPE